MLSGAISALIFLSLCGFHPGFSVFSAGMALGQSLCCIGYSLIGFSVLRSGGMALYSTFLMSGGMLLPYFYGVFLLDERLTPMRILGVVLILCAVVLSNFSKQRTDRKLLLLCCGVFLLNGCVSILSKHHQSCGEGAAVSSAAFVLYTSLGRIICSAAALPFFHKARDDRGFSLRIVSVVAGAAGIGALSYLLQLVGAKSLPATVLYPMVTGGCILFSALAGRVFFGERLLLPQRVSIVLCFAGTLLFL